MAFSAPLGCNTRVSTKMVTRQEGEGRGRTSTYAKLNGDGEEVDTGLLGDLLTTGDTGQVDVAGLDEALGTLDGLQQLLSEAGVVVSIVQQDWIN